MGQKTTKDIIMGKRKLEQDEEEAGEDIQLNGKEKAMMDQLEDRLQYKFRKRLWLVEALTHRSWNAKNPSPGTPTYPETFHLERLEFLGDSILGQVVAAVLFDVENSSLRESEMTRRRSALVDWKNCCKVAQGLGVTPLIRTGGGTKVSESVLADATEAIIGAVFKDSGSFKTAKKFVLRHFISESSLEEAAGHLKNNPIMVFGELFQKRFQISVPQPVYETIGNNADSHSLTFRATIDMTNFGPKYTTAMGIASDQKTARANACAEALKLLKANGDLNVAAAPKKKNTLVDQFSYDPIIRFTTLRQRKLGLKDALKVDYTSVKQGIFRATISLSEFCKDLPAASGEGQGKQNARRVALHQALQILEEKGIYDPDTFSESNEKNGESPKAKIQKTSDSSGVSST